MVLVLYGNTLYSQYDLGLDLGDLDIEFSDLSEGTEQETDASNLSDFDLDNLNNDIGNIEALEDSKKEAKPQVKDIAGTSDRELELTDLDIFEEQLLKSKQDTLYSVEDIDPDLIIDESIEAVKEASQASPEIFNIGPDEKKLLELAKYVERKIPANEWNEIAARKKIDRYIVQKGDWLWKISKNFFDSGFYYSKIWSLNPQITNPHEIEPGMVLVFNTGDTDEMPNVQLGEFQNDSQKNRVQKKSHFNFRAFGDGTPPAWLTERENLLKQGAYFQYASIDTYQDLLNTEELLSINEYKIYNPIEPLPLQKQQQELSRSFKKIYNVEKFREEKFLNTFITTNLVQDLGFIDSFRNENVHAFDNQYVYIKFDNDAHVAKGFPFSIYEAHGSVKPHFSDREGFRYSIKAHLKANRKVQDLWECQILEITGLVERKDRVTIYVPRISKVANFYSRRSIEAAVIASYKGSYSISLGDIVYLDRGRKDGVEVGTIFSIYDFFDRGTKKKISSDPTYSIGTLQVLSVTENFSTAYVLTSSDHIKLGQLALTMSEEEMLKRLAKKKNKVPKPLLKNFDVELNIEDLSGDLLKEAHKVQLSDDEINELKNLEQKTSVLTEHERDVLELSKLEKSISASEAAADELKVDEDKFLEQMNLDSLERKDPKNPNAFRDLDEIEKDVGRQYMDENINSQENPYGLTEFDLEEIDELLNTESL